MPLTYNRMSTLALEFFFGPQVPLMFNVVAHSCLCRHKSITNALKMERHVDGRAWMSYGVEVKSTYGLKKKTQRLNWIYLILVFLKGLY